jgi:hypothetical protein
MSKKVKSKLNPVPFFQRLVNAYYKKDDTGIKIEAHTESDIEYANRVPNVNPPVNAQGIPITYENKDELNEEDFK